MVSYNMNFFKEITIIKCITPNLVICNCITKVFVHLDTLQRHTVYVNFEKETLMGFLP